MMKTISILGSTGSIGTQSLDIIRENREEYRVKALTCGSNIQLLSRQIDEFHPDIAVTAHEKDAATLSKIHKGVEFFWGREGLIKAAEAECGLLLNALVGMRGMEPTYRAIKMGRNIALANKETLVAGGEVIMPLTLERGVGILPVDSEHSAIFQSLEGNEGRKIRKILLTASGGPFRGATAQQLKEVTLKQALKHPNWSMGRKITIDSSTLVNKGLEVMEAKWLFDVALDQIQVVVHPQSVIHSAVEYEDGAVIAQLGTPDMRLPIQYALYYPKRKHLSGKRLDLFALRDLTFERPDTDTFRGLSLAYDAARRGGNIPTVFNAANEKAVAMFLDRKIAYPEITEMIEAAMEEVSYIAHPDLEQILETEQATYEYIGGRW